MTNNYNSLSYRKDSKLSSLEPDVIGNGSKTPSSFIRASWLFCLMLFVSLFLGQNAFSQVSYNQQFTADAASWSGFSHFTGATACGGSGGAVRFNLYSGATSADLVSPDLGTANGTTVQTITYDYKIADWSANTSGTPANFGNFVVQWSNSAAGPWTTIQTVDASNHVVSGSCANKSVSFTPTAGSLFVRFSAAWNNGDYYLNFDNVNVSFLATSPPNCATALLPADGATNVLRNPSFSWTAATGGPTSYDVYLGTVSPAPFVGNVATTSYLVTSGLLANTLYYYKVVAKNAIGDAIGCTEQSFTTGNSLQFCDPVYTSGKTSGDLISNISILGTSLANNTGTAPVNPAYTYFTGQPNYTATLQAATSYSVSVSVGTFASQNIAAWIDYNDNGVFEASEKIGTTGPGTAAIGANGTASFSITLACNPPLGLHRMRVRDVWLTSGTSIDPCASYGWGETEDYDVTISAADPCPVPTNLTASAITAGSANLAWNVGCAETNWEVALQPAGTGIPTGSGIATTTNSYSASGLTNSTNYEFYVRAACTPGSLYSNWAGPFAFQTTDFAPACAGLVAPADGETNVSYNAGAVTLTWTAPAVSPTEGAATSYDVYLGTTSGSLTLIGNTTALTVGVTNLLYSTTYFWRIAPRNSGGPNNSCAQWSFTTPVVPANDICTGATALDALTSPISNSTVGYGNNFTPTCGSTFSHTAPDVYYSIVVPNGYTLNIGNTASSFDSATTLFYGSCTTQNLIGCNDSELLIQSWTNTTGSAQTAYWVQDGWSAGAGTFTLAWTLVPPPVVITSFTPTEICGQLGGSVVTISGSNFTGTTSVTFNGIPATSFTVNSDTSLSATVPAGNTTGNIAVFSAPSSNGSATSTAIFTAKALPVVDPITGPATALCIPNTLNLDNNTPTGLWTSSNEAIATVDGGGLVTGVSEGTVTITYTVTDNGCSTAVTYSVDVKQPVTITSQPNPQIVLTGNTATFTVAATGSSLSYQWEESQDNGATFAPITNAAPFSGVTTSTLTISATPASLNTFEYRCVVSGASPCGPETSNSALLTVGNTGIDTNPSNVTLCDSGSATFSVVASGSVLGYQWYEDQGFGAAPIANGGNYSGATTATLSISGITTLNNGWSYYVIVDGPANDPQSTTATLTVNEGVSVVSLTSSQPSACQGVSSTNFTVATAGTVASTQWQYATSATGPWSNVVNNTPNGVTYSGATTSVLGAAATAATPVGTYFYRVVVNGASPCLPVNSAAISLSITAPTIAVTPSAATYCNPGTAVSITASGASTYSWSPATGLSSTTGATVLASPSVTTIYTVTGTDASGCTSTSTVTISVGSAVQGTATTNLTEVCANALVQLGIVPTESNPAYTINTGTYKFEATSGVFTPLVGGTATSLAATADDNISNSAPIGFTFNFGGTNYTNFRASSNGLLTFNTTGNGGAGNDLAIGTASYRPSIAPLWDDLLCTSGVTYQVSGTSPNRILTVQWLNMNWNWNSTVGISFQVKLFEGSNDIQLIYNQAPGGNPTGSGGASIGLMGTAASNFVSLQNTSANPTLSTTASTNTIGTKPASGQVYMFKRVTPVTYSYAWTSTPAGFTSTLRNPTVNPTVSTTYNVVATSSAGCNVSSNVTVNVTSGATITTQPVALISQCAGTNASFTVAASGPAGITYQWRRNGVNITGNASATTSTLNLTALVEANEGSYDVVVTPLCGAAVISSPASSLIVNDIPTAVPTNNGPVCVGSTLNLTGTTSNGVTFAWTGPNGFTSTAQNPSISNVTAANAGVYRFTATSESNCVFSGTTNVFVNENPAVTITSSGNQTAACAGEIKTLTANYAPGAAFTIYSENFNSPTNAWTKVNNSTGGTTPANAAWTLRPSPFTQSTTTFTSNDASQYYLSNSDASGSGVTTSATLTSPAFSTVGTTSASISFFHYYRHLTATQNVEYSLNGTTWISLKTYNTTQGAANAFVQDNIALPAGAINQPTVYIRFRYQDGWAWYWAIDNFSVRGVAPNSVSWAPTAGLYTDANATVPYTGAPATTVYASVNAPVSYTATLTTFAGCTNSSTASYAISTTSCPSTTNVQSSQCGVTLATIDQEIFANLVAGAQGYRFRVTNTATNQVQTIDRFLRVFRITQLPVFAFNTTYQIEVSVRINNIWQPFYGAPCTVSTPATTTQLQSAQCGGTLTSMADVIYANNVPFATGYRFRVTNLVTSAQQVLVRSLREFRMNLLTNPSYNATYSVEVAVRNTDGTYLPYGPVCNITTPSFPTSEVQLSQCDYTALSNTETIFATSVTGATVYRFRLTNPALGYSYTIDRTTRTFTLGQFPGLQSGTTYTIQVSLQIGGVFGPYGKACALTTPGVARQETAAPVKVEAQSVVFKATAYPNPFASDFKLNVTTSSEEKVQVRVYDMLGKLIEDKQVATTDLENLEVGASYPSGVYNVIVSQGENTQTLRVIKR